MLGFLERGKSRIIPPRGNSGMLVPFSEMMNPGKGGGLAGRLTH